MWQGTHWPNELPHIHQYSEYGDSRLKNKWSVVAKHSTETKHSINIDGTEGIANIQTYHPTSSGKLLK
jgi:hypothetical protein